jgi:lipoyl-dependent peroxiredoxin
VNFRVTRSAQASWQGTVPEGTGRIALGSGAFDGPYSLRARVEEGVRLANPEELLGAAEAACFTMSFANVLEQAGHPARDLRTTARVTLAQGDAGFDITRIELHTVGDVPGVDPASGSGAPGEGLHDLARLDRHGNHTRGEPGRSLTGRGSWSPARPDLLPYMIPRQSSDT